jgi:hypothetical protein
MIVSVSRLDRRALTTALPSRWRSSSSNSNKVAAVTAAKLCHEYPDCNPSEKTETLLTLNKTMNKVVTCVGGTSVNNDLRSTKGSVPYGNNSDALLIPDPITSSAFPFP